MARPRAPLLRSDPAEVNVADGDGSLLDPEFRRKLDLLDLVARRAAGREVRGERASRDRGVGTIFADHRSYTPGDDLRYLDWNVFGRLGVPMTKEFELRLGAPD